MRRPSSCCFCRKSQRGLPEGKGFLAKNGLPEAGFSAGSLGRNVSLSRDTLEIWPIRVGHGIVPARDALRHWWIRWSAIAGAVVDVLRDVRLVSKVRPPCVLMWRGGCGHLRSAAIVNIAGAGCVEARLRPLRCQLFWVAAANDNDGDAMRGAGPTTQGRSP